MLACLILGAMNTIQEPAIADLIKQVDAKRMRATIEKLSSWNTRNTNTPECVQAAEWLAGEYRKIPGLQVEIFKYQVRKGSRVPEDKEVVEVVAVLPGKANRRILVGGHFDTINMGQGLDLFTARAPGANDDGSGTAMALELARILSLHKWENTLVFVAFSGEEQGLLGSAALAKRARDENWDLEAVLSNDMIGNPGNHVGLKNNKEVRVFSEEYIPPTGARGSVRAGGGANGNGNSGSDGASPSNAATAQQSGPRPHNSRELARWIEWNTRQHIKGHSVKLVFRRDRFGRGGDHTPFVAQGFTAVRFVEVVEEYDHQHTIMDLPEFIDWKYLANNAKVNLAAMAALANAGEAPTNVRMVRDQGHNSRITWRATAGVKYVVYVRDTASPVWEKVIKVGASDHYLAEKINVDDHIFAVAAINGIPVVAQ